MTEKKFYLFRVTFVGSEQMFGILFKAPPVRQHVEAIFRKEWNKLKPAEQEGVWEWLLILDFIPTEPWKGTIETFYGTLEVIEKEFVDNTDEQKVPKDAGRDQGCPRPGPSSFGNPGNPSETVHEVRDGSKED